ncbi:MAG: hypothetical protein Kow0042_24530 [Calditrichia bacterium]
MQQVLCGGDSISFRIDSWGCIYQGKLSADCLTISGGFSCEGEPPDRVDLKRVSSDSLIGLYPVHLDTTGNYYYRYRQPQKKGDGLKTGNAKEFGLSPQILIQMVQQVGRCKYGRIHSLLILKDDHLVCEEYFFGFDSEVLHPLESVTKSVTSLLLGIAWGQGKIGSMEQLVHYWFPEYADLLRGTKHNIQLRHLLTMRSGLQFDEQGMLFNPDRMRFLLSSALVDTPGRNFRYSAGNTELLGAIIRRATGKPADLFAAENLFRPLSIRRFSWDIFKQGELPLCGGALWLRPRDMAKIGLLVLNGGRWQGIQIVPMEWIEKSTAPLVETGIGEDRYGFQWWVSQIESGKQSFRMVWANGLGSQFIFIFPELDLLLVTTGGNWDGGNGGRSWEIIELLKNYLQKLISKES